MFDRFTLAEDLVDCRGHVLGRRGLVVSPEAIADAARRAPALPRTPLCDTALAADATVSLDEPAYGHLFGRDGARDEVEAALLAVRLPDVLVDELLAIRRSSPASHRHAFATAAVSVRMLLAA